MTIVLLRITADIKADNVTQEMAGLEGLTGSQRVEVTHQQVRLAFSPEGFHDAQDLRHLTHADMAPSPATIEGRRKMGHKHGQRLTTLFLDTNLQQRAGKHTRTRMNFRIYNGQTRQQCHLVISTTG